MSSPGNSLFLEPPSSSSFTEGPLEAFQGPFPRDESKKRKEQSRHQFKRAATKHFWHALQLSISVVLPTALLLCFFHNEAIKMQDHVLMGFKGTICLHCVKRHERSAAFPILFWANAHRLIVLTSFRHSCAQNLVGFLELKSQCALHLHENGTRDIFSAFFRPPEGNFCWPIDPEMIIERKQLFPLCASFVIFWRSLSTQMGVVLRNNDWLSGYICS